MYAKLIFKNAKRSVKDCLIYIVTMTLCVTLFYAFLSISSTHYHPTIGAEYNISLLAGGMKLAICGISLLLLFLIHYVNRFMLRKKQSEFAVEATLGMEQKTIGLLFFGETFFLLIFSVSVGILLGMVVSQVITAMLLASFGEPYAFSWSFFPDTVLLTVGFFVICQILVGVGNVRILNKSRIIELMTANRQNEKPLHKSRWMPIICIFYGIMLLWMLEVGAVKYHFYFDPRHPLPVKLMYWGNVLFPALTLLWAIAGAVLHRKIGFSRYLCGLLAGAVLTAIPIFSIAELEKAYFLGFDAPTLNQYLLFGVADILFIISAVMYLSNAALLYWKESKVSRKYHNTSLFLFGQLSSKLATNTKTMTIICVTLTFSICLFVIAPVLTGWSLGYLDSRAVYDIQISSRYNDVYEVENLPDTDYGEITAFIEQNNIAIKDDLTFSEYLPQKSDFHQRVKYDFPPLAISLTDYNAVREMLGYRFDKVRERAKLKQSVSRLVTILFPELEKLVPSLHIASVYALLSEYPGAKQISEIHLTKLTNLLATASKGRYGKDKAIQIRDAARTSIGSVMPAKFLELKHTIKLIRELTSEIDEIEVSIQKIMDELNPPILSIPGVGIQSAAMILAEIGDFSNFESPDKILAYAGCSPSTYQSGKLTNCYAHMEKRGSRYLRYALYNATKYVCHWNPVFAEYLAKKRAEGKHYNVALSHATKKLVRLIYALQKSGKAYLVAA